MQRDDGASPVNLAPLFISNMRQRLLVASARGFARSLRAAGRVYTGNRSIMGSAQDGAPIAPPAWFALACFLSSAPCFAFLFLCLFGLPPWRFASLAFMSVFAFLLRFCFAFSALLLAFPPLALLLFSRVVALPVGRPGCRFFSSLPFGCLQ